MFGRWRDPNEPIMYDDTIIAAIRKEDNRRSRDDEEEEGEDYMGKLEDVKEVK